MYQLGLTAFLLAFTWLLSPLVLAPVYAEGTSAVCSPPRSTPDATSGVLGASQTINVLANDSPTVGHSFVASSLRLRLVGNPRAGSVLGANSMTVTVPGEGTYTALNTGFIVFTPEPVFVGTTLGVAYTITDTVGATTSNTYTPTVSGAPVATCSDPASETRVLAPLLISYINGVDEYIYDDWLAMSGNSPLLDPLLLDLNPAESGTQTTLSYPLEGWTANYNPSTDKLTLSVTDWIVFYTTVDRVFCSRIALLPLQDAPSRLPPMPPLF
ncbi:hypothetical protein IPL68_06005 [Candidatus Saccharibacteria bacterium]|nr:MAG: hypothetical protein IPL68_06005 [Candidatus Saccharibacteria bacterium]